MKLSIMNKDLKTFELLWTDNILLWNMAHYFIVLQAMMKYNWE